MARKRRHREDRSPNRAVADRPADSVRQELKDALGRANRPDRGIDCRVRLRESNSRRSRRRDHRRARALVGRPQVENDRGAGDGNTLSTVYRQAWDSGLLRVLNKNSPVKATGAHISIIGHITRDELLMELSNNDKVNGFGNRNLWLCVQRSKFLPDGGDWDHLDIEPLISRLKNAVEFARGVGEMRRNAEAGAMWHEVY